MKPTTEVMTMMKTSAEKKAILTEFISKYLCEHGYSPTLAEIEKGTGISKSAAQRFVSRMVEDGVLDSNTQRRAMTDKKMQTEKVPILGRVACGIPKFAEENIEDYVRLPVSMFGKGDFFLLRAYGDSMIDAGINDNDLVLVRKQPTANTGQIVVALTNEDEATLKRYYPEKDHIRLHPENPDFDDIIVKNCVIQGVAVKVIKDLE